MPNPIPAEAASPYRILVTGSRSWTDWVTVWTALEDAIEQAHAQGYARYVVVHGGAKGADELAAKFCEDQAGWYSDYGNQTLTEECHPADWGAPCRPTCRHGYKIRADRTQYCPTAGVYRNQAMVDLGADLCLAFQVGNSKGTADCIRRAEKAGIPVRRYQPLRAALPERTDHA
ncbi:SLOG family protein [Nonomuraea pusilla]|uniref:YspA cpYpsA-related SLOG domain-containing protein n=1 Tax=Nonomuraea pusilla TaxID=46177 RepID=A0A1H8K653_9ACTN|nr:SLOG family protein [Nonomuraea pusilla]SEN88221.1 Protein of unknown function [Nonomuraea pusilla]